MISLSVLLVFQIFTTTDAQVKQYLPGDCYNSQKQYAFAWIFPLDLTNLSTHDEVVESSNEACKLLFKDVKIVVDSSYEFNGLRYYFTVLELKRPDTNFNEATNIDYSVLEIESFKAPNSRRDIICLRFETYYKVIYPGYSSRGMDAFGLIIPIKHNGVWIALRPKDKELFIKIWEKLGEPDYIENFNRCLSVDDIKRWPKFNQ